MNGCKYKVSLPFYCRSASRRTRAGVAGAYWPCGLHPGLRGAQACWGIEQDLQAARKHTRGFPGFYQLPINIQRYKPRPKKRIWRLSAGGTVQCSLYYCRLHESKSKIPCRRLLSLLCLNGTVFGILTKMILPGLEDLSVEFPGS